MDDSPPPAYSEHPAARNIPFGKPDGSNSAKPQGRHPRPLPLPPGTEPPGLKAGMVSPLRVHKKSQSAALPVNERPWKSPLDGGPSTPTPPQFRPREGAVAAAGSKYGAPPPPPLPSTPTSPLPEYVRTGYFSPSPPNTSYGRPSPSTTMDANAFYNPAVSGYLPRPYMQSPPRANPSDNRPTYPPSNSSNSSRGNRVRWAS